MSAFPHACYLRGAHTPAQFVPDVGSEVVFAGRSNSGKSSAINAITQRRALARTSKTPGQTQLVNFFELEPQRRLVDLPGYGFAKVPRALQQHWKGLLEAYFEGRESLTGLVIVMDARRPLGPQDWQMLEYARARWRGCGARSARKPPRSCSRPSIRAAWTRRGACCGSGSRRRPASATEQRHNKKARRRMPSPGQTNPAWG